MGNWEKCTEGLERKVSKYEYDSAFFDFYKGKKVLITGISGFKGSWMLKILSMCGARVCGYALRPPTEPALFDIIGGRALCGFVEGDIRDLEKLKATFAEFKPEIVIHMAAQPLVIESYKNPVYTYETNVMGTVNVCECVRLSESVRAFLNVTTDKVYLNNEWEWGYREDEKLMGYDPYSNSKSCSELVTYSYARSFPRTAAVSTARAGNVIGGGDFAENRIIPDCVRAAVKGGSIIVRNPYSTRPYQHVLEPVFAYLMLCREMYNDGSVAGNYNVGPDFTDCLMTGDIVDMFCRAWGNICWENRCHENAPHEANFLKLDCSKIKKEFGWQPRWNAEKAVDAVVEWTRAYYSGRDAAEIMEKQIKEYVS